MECPGSVKKDAVNIPYFVHEGVMARMDRCNKRLLGALVTAVSALLIDNIAWLIYEHITYKK